MPSLIDTSVVPSKRPNGNKLWEQAIGTKLPIVCNPKRKDYVVLEDYDDKNKLVLLKYKENSYWIESKHAHDIVPVAITEPQLSKGLPQEVIWEETRTSKKEIECTCLRCQRPMGKRKISNYIRNLKGCCSVCNDGFSYPQKYVNNIIEQLSVVYDIDYTYEKTFKWCRYQLSNGENKTGRYDIYFIFQGKPYIVEVDGNWHFTDNVKSGQSKEITKEIDKNKDRLAKEQGIKVIRIPCKKSNGQLIKRNVLKSELSKIFDLSIIDWQECEKSTLQSKTMIIKDLWDKGYGKKEISKITHIPYGSIKDRLSKLYHAGLLPTYTKEEITNRRVRQMKKTLKKQRRKVIRINDGKIWDDYIDCANEMKLTKENLANILKTHRANYLTFNNEPLYIMYEDEYKEKGNLCEFNILHEQGWIGNTYNGRNIRCICLNDGNKFLNCEAAAEYYGESIGTVASVVAGRYHKTKTGLVFVQYDKYLKMTNKDKNELLNFKYGTERYKPIILLNTMEKFNSIDEAADNKKITRTMLSANLNKHNPYAKLDEFYHEGLVFVFEKDYSSDDKIYLTYNTRFPPIICIDTKEIFWCPNSIKRYYGLRIDSHCKFMEYYCNNDGYYNGKQWMYLAKYFELHPEIQNQISFYREHLVLDHELKGVS